MKIRAGFITLFLVGVTLYGQEVTIPLDHQVYPLLLKGEALGLVKGYQMRLLPLTREEIRTLLTGMQKGEDQLSMADCDLLRQMRGEFTDPAIGQPAKPESEIHLYRYEEGKAQIFVDLRGIQSVQLNRQRIGLPDETVLETSAFGSIRARFGNHIFVGAQARNSMARGINDEESRFDVSRGETQVAVGGSVFTDQATGYVAVSFGLFKAFLGRMEFGWGSGIQDQLGLSSRNEPMDQVRMNLEFERFRFSYVHANLQGIGFQRYLAGHRLDILFSESFQAGVYETVVYAGRGPEFEYLNPFLPYQIMEHQLGDRDNNTFGFDLTAALGKGVKAYAEVFVDDYSFNRSLATYWGNKLAYMAGVHWAEPFRIRTLELFATYTRVDPFVYTHDDTLNIYSHYGESVGSRLGPNADRYHLSGLWRPVRDFTLRMEYEYSRKGRGSVFVAHKQEEGEEKGYLAGTLETRNALRLSLRYQFTRDFFAGLNVFYTDRVNADTVPGLNGAEKSIRLFVDLNY